MGEDICKQWYLLGSNIQNIWRTATTQQQKTTQLKHGWNWTGVFQRRYTDG